MLLLFVFVINNGKNQNLKSTNLLLFRNILCVEIDFNDHSRISYKNLAVKSVHLVFLFKVIHEFNHDLDTLSTSYKLCQYLILNTLTVYN